MAQAVPVLASTILARVYTPEEFAVFALIISITMLGAVLATGRYEVAIMLPESEEEVKHLNRLAFSISLCFSAVLLLAVIFFRFEIAGVLGLASRDSLWLFWLPLFIFLTVLYQILTLNAARKKEFKILATNRVGKSLSMVTSQIALGFSKLAGGLIIGNLIAMIYSLVFLSYKQKIPFRKAKWTDVRVTAAKYKKFPKYSLMADSVNSFSNQVPIVLMLRFFSEAAAGHYGLTQRVLSLPVGLIAGAFLDVFKQKASEDYNTLGNCKDIYLKTLKRLAIIAIPTFGILALLAPELFSFFFGEEWIQSGVYARILCVMFAMRIIASPLSYVFYIAGKQNYDLIWQVALAIATVLAFYVGQQGDSAEIALWIFSLSYGGLYLVYIAISYRLSLGKRELK